MWESLFAKVECGLVFSKGEDRKVWEFDSSDTYSIYSGCQFLDSLSTFEALSFSVFL